MFRSRRPKRNAVAIADFTGSDAEELRRARGSRRFADKVRDWKSKWPGSIHRVYL
jgi:hypothetical protein